MDSMLKFLQLNLATDRPEIFATDVVHFVSSEFGAGWNPAGLRYYFPHVLSPFSPRMREAMRLILRDRDREFRTRFQNMAPEDPELCAAIFSAHSRSSFFQVFYREPEVSVAELFETVTYIARLGVLFQQRGLFDALDRAVLLISEAVAHFNSFHGPGLFSAFAMVADAAVTNSS